MISRIIISLLLITSILAKQRNTRLTFFAEFQDDQQEDFIQLGLSVKSDGRSLVGAMNQASVIANSVKSIASDFCQAHIKNKKQAKATCKDIVEIGNYQIQPKYQIVKRQSKFMGFQVIHEVTIKVLAVNDISDLADQLLKLKSVKIVSFEWKPIEQTNIQENAVKQGMEQGEGLCHQIGMHLQRTVNVEQIQIQGDQQNSVYKLEIDCAQGQNARKVKPKAEQKKDSKQDKKSDKDEKNQKSQKGQKSQKKQDKKQKQKKKDEL